MRPVQVVVLVNLALALGIGGGYLWWGREVASLRREVVAARAAQVAGGEREFHGQGVVRAVLPEIGVLVITHDDITGYMPPMTMGFRAASPQVYDGIKVGDTVRFVLRGVPPNVVLTGVARTGS
jgi:Cu/Ag efflux protein CusF